MFGIYYVSRTAQGGSCMLLFIVGGEVNQRCMCHTNQLVFTPEVFSLVEMTLWVLKCHLLVVHQAIMGYYCSLRPDSHWYLMAVKTSCKGSTTTATRGNNETVQHWKTNFNEWNKGEIYVFCVFSLAREKNSRTNLLVWQMYVWLTNGAVLHSSVILYLSFNSGDIKFTNGSHKNSFIYIH